ncbi:hypothetical protein E2C01_059638 [Portunus trituberculatus]|uniref:Secreted protein n=1 Tax=Portunus trituberculatus TaxID=210409 RepID=A0A5B7H5X3_PORTR|nr:hypothetical protein [Portunus trituberculatus]
MTCLLLLLLFVTCDFLSRYSALDLVCTFESVLRRGLQREVRRFCSFTTFIASRSRFPPLLSLRYTT